MASQPPTSSSGDSSRTVPGLAAQRQLMQLLAVIGVAGLYAVAAEAGTRLSYPDPRVVLILPSAGVALGVLLLGGMRLWPGVFIGHLGFALLHARARYRGQGSFWMGAIYAGWLVFDAAKLAKTHNSFRPRNAVKNPSGKPNGFSC